MYSNKEKEYVERLERGVTEAIVGIRDKLPSPNTNSASLALIALQDSIERRLGIGKSIF